MTLKKKLLIASMALGLTACAGEDPGSAPPDDLFGLDEASAYAGNLEQSQNAPSDEKADQVLPATFDLVATQSPIRSQGSRGVCSIFGTTALMEHLYITEGTLTDLDLSEQFLQWSSKFETRQFLHTGGSNANVNIQTASRYGSVLESDWPYETQGWGESDDAECTGEDADKPTRCFTNGAPPMAALMAQRYTIQRGRWVSNRVASIKAHMFSTNTAVQAGGTFFYQAWGHGGSRIPKYSGYREQGYILAPNAADIASSNEHRAGHSFLLVGWDDNLSVQSVNAEGELAVDAAGEPVMQTGFFLFKNSWGDGWATENPHGAGYGWIAYDYVSEHLSAYASGVPEVSLTEICGDGRDNDHNSFIDCADSACANDRGCMDPAGTYSNRMAVEIPDNDSMGATSTIEITEAGLISSLAVTLDIEHSYRGDLSVFLEKDGTRIQLVERSGGGEDNIMRTFDVDDFDGQETAGIWTLQVIDGAASDTGTLRSWSLNITRCAGGDCDTMPTVSSYQNDTLVIIPDGDTMGANSNIEVMDSGTVGATRVTVNISHTFPPDLVISLTHGDNTVELIRSPQVTDAAFVQTFTVADFNGDDTTGTWTLNVTDDARNDEGTLNSWTLELTH